VLAVLAGTGASTLTDWGSIAAIVAGAIAVLALAWGIGRWLLRAYLIRNAVKVVYLIPQSHYNGIERFPGAPLEEREETDIAVGMGSYNLIFKLKPRTAIHVADVRLVFQGDPHATLPIEVGRESRFYVDDAPSGERRDWWGSLHTPRELPRDLMKDLQLAFGRQVRTSGEWSGSIVVHVEARTLDGSAARLLELPLGFHVVENSKGDRLPFLRQGQN
jgi:hypothetical protein